MVFCELCCSSLEFLHRRWISILIPWHVHVSVARLMVSYPSSGPAPSWTSSYSSFCSLWISFFCSCFYRFSSWAWRMSCSTSPSAELSACPYNWVLGTAPSCRKWRHSVNHQKRVINACCSLQWKIWQVASIRRVLYIIFSITALWWTKNHTQTLVKTLWHLYSKNYSLCLFAFPGKFLSDEKPTYINLRALDYDQPQL